MVFDPQPHLIQLPRKVKDKATGHYTTVYDDYLEVRWRLVMFRDRYPHGIITTEEICVDLDRGYARYRATVADGEGGQASGYGTETQAGFADYVERAETRALGRALAVLGFGTQFVGQDLTEGEHIVDAPVVSTNGQPASTPLPPGEGEVSVVSTNGQAPVIIADVLPTSIPTDLKLPCGGALIVDLRPAQLALLIGKVGLRAMADKSLESLHVALLAERARRFEQGQRAEANSDVP
jgi:hypothetical protein